MSRYSETCGERAPNKTLKRVKSVGAPLSPQGPSAFDETSKNGGEIGVVNISARYNCRERSDERQNIRGNKNTLIMWDKGFLVVFALGSRFLF